MAASSESDEELELELESESDEEEDEPPEDFFLVGTGKRISQYKVELYIQVKRTFSFACGVLGAARAE